MAPRCSCNKAHLSKTHHGPCQPLCPTFLLGHLGSAHYPVLPVSHAQYQHELRADPRHSGLCCLHAFICAIPSALNTLPLWSSRQTTVPFQVLTRMPPPFDSPGGLRCPFSYGPSGAYTGTMEVSICHIVRVLLPLSGSLTPTPTGWGVS